MKKIVLSTTNQGKVREFNRLLNGHGFEIISITSVVPDFVFPEETGATFVENAILKSDAACKASGLPALADDSGICVYGLGLAPGIHSARYGGDGLDDSGRVDLLLHNMQDISDRRAYFYCALAFSQPGLPAKVFSGQVDGELLHKRAGDGGFGYDPIFWYTPLNMTLAQIPLEQKNTVSHRAKAVEGFIDWFKNQSK